MNHKHIFLTTLILISFFAVMVSAKAAELPSAGTTPDSPLYIFKTWKESIQTFFTFGLENKAKQYLHLADIRLAEYQKMVDKGKTEIAQKTLDKYESQLNRALEKAEEAKQKGKDVKDISQKLEDKIAKHTEVLENNLQKVPEQARKGIEKAIDNSGKAIEKITGKPKKVSIDDFSQSVKEKIQGCEKLSDEIIGSPISVNSEKDKCLTELAIAEINMKICYLIDDAIFRDDINKKDSRINYCFGNYAYKLNDVKGCKMMVGDYSSQCYSHLDKKTNSNNPQVPTLKSGN